MPTMTRAASINNERAKCDLLAAENERLKAENEQLRAGIDVLATTLARAYVELKDRRMWALMVNPN